MLRFTLLEVVLTYVAPCGFASLVGESCLWREAFSFLTGLAFFVYFLYWGWTRLGVLRLLPDVGVITIIIVLLISCVFVARCAWLGFVVAFHEANCPGLPNWRRHGYEVLLCLAALLILVPIVLKQSSAGEADEPPVTVLSTADRWIVIGVDGVSLDLLQRFSASGDLPKSYKNDSEIFCCSP